MAATWSAFGLSPVINLNNCVAIFSSSPTTSTRSPFWQSETSNKAHRAKRQANDLPSLFVGRIRLPIQWHPNRASGAHDIHRGGGGGDHFQGGTKCRRQGAQTGQMPP